MTWDKKRKISIWGMSNQDTAVYQYRIIQPLQGIAKQRFATVHHLPFFGQHARHLTSPEFREYQALEGKWADVLFTTLGSDRHYLALILALKERYGLKLVVDLDDDILATYLEPNNPAYSAYVSGEGKHAEYAQLCLQQADLVTVSTDYLKRKYAPHNANILVVPNCPDPSLFAPSKQEGPVTIGYAGSGSHQKDWEMVEPVLRKLKEEKGVKIKVLGPMVTAIADEQVSWVEALEYPKALSDLGISIGVAPLKDSAMSRGKSNLRWLEYSMLKVPTVASDTVPFRGIDNIFLVSEPEDWERQLAYLVESPEARKSLGEAAYAEALTKFSQEAVSRDLFSSFKDLF